MMPRYYEVIVSGRQLAVFIVAIVALVLVAFGLGVAVHIGQPRDLAGERAVLVAGGGVTAMQAPPPVSTQMAGSVAAQATGSPVSTPAPEAAVGAVAATAPIPDFTPVPTAVSERPTPSRPATRAPARATRTAAPPPPSQTPAISPSQVADQVPTAVSPTGDGAPGATTPTQPTGRWVQAALLSRRDSAEGVRTRVVALGFTPEQVVLMPAEGGKYRIRVGPFPDGESAGRVAARLRAQGFGGAFVVKPGE
jgi:cell division protein FtsN